MSTLEPFPLADWATLPLALWATWLACAALLAPLGAASMLLVRQLTVPACDEADESLVARRASTAAALATACLAAAALCLAADPPPAALSPVLATWFASPDLSVNISLRLDRLGLGFALLCATLTWFGLRFATRYLHREPGFTRFFLAMTLFLAGLLLIALAGNLGLFFAGWELAGLASYLLIGFMQERPTASGGALFVFVSNRIGDAGMLLAIVLTAAWLGSLEWATLHDAHALPPLQLRLLLGAFLLPALAKSAQLPFSPWLTRALEGPTPSSALFYGALLVHAGLFLVLRLEPLWRQLPDMQLLLAAIGLATALYGWLGGLVQTDVKSSLAMATTTHIGLLFVACGLGAYDLAFALLVTHALWRAWQFLLAPSWLHLAAPARAPGWLQDRTRLYSAVQQRFWLERLAHTLLTRPTLGLGRDMRAFDEGVIDRGLGAFDAAPDGTPTARHNGAASHALAVLAERLARLEARLVLHGGATPGRWLQRVGDALRVIESLLERPRYLLLLVMATFVVIL